jgi:hypothetical protein
MPSPSSAGIQLRTHPIRLWSESPKWFASPNSPTIDSPPCKLTLCDLWSCYDGFRTRPGQLVVQPCRLEKTGTDLCLRILNALGKCEILNDLHFVSAKSFLIFCLTCRSRRPFRILWPTLDNRRRFCSKNSQSGSLLTLLRISSAVSSSSIAKLSDAKSLILAISNKLWGTFLRFEIESHKRKSSIYSLWVWSMLIPLSKQILSSSGSGKEWRSSALMSWSS